MWPISIIYNTILSVISIWWAVAAMFVLNSGGDDVIAILLILGLAIIVILSLQSLFFIYKRNKLFIRYALYQYIFSLLFVTGIFSSVEEFLNTQMYLNLMYGVILIMTIALSTLIYSIRLREFFKISTDQKLNEN